jgi:hypothetical protein
MNSAKNVLRLLWKRAFGASRDWWKENHGNDEPLKDGQDAPKRREIHSNG